MDFHRLLDELLERQDELLSLDLFSDDRRRALARVEWLMDRVMEAGRADMTRAGAGPDVAAAQPSD